MSLVEEPMIVNNGKITPLTTMLQNQYKRQITLKALFYVLMVQKMNLVRNHLQMF